MARVDELAETDIREMILTMPFKKFAQRGFLSYDRDASRLRFAPMLWQRIGDEDARQQIRGLAETSLGAYYQHLGHPDSIRRAAEDSKWQSMTRYLVEIFWSDDGKLYLPYDEVRVSRVCQAAA